MKEKVERVYRVLCPYVDELVKATLTKEAHYEQATIEALVEFLCFKAELTVRKAVKEINQKMRRGELEEVRRIVQENPEVVRKAANYVARKLKRRIRRIIKEELEMGEEDGYG